MAQKFQRKILWVDRAFQVRLLARMGAYVVLYPIMILHIGFIFELAGRIIGSVPVNSFQGYYLEYLGRHRFLLFGLVLFLPSVLGETLKFSHRIAGPFSRCRKTILAMASGEPVQEFKPRKNDLMPEFFEAFNGLVREWNARLGVASNGALQQADTKAPATEPANPAAPADVCAAPPFTSGESPAPFDTFLCR